MKQRRAWSAIVPALLVFAVTAAYVLLSSDSPSRMTLELSYAPPSGERPLGSGEAGVNLLALGCHATFRALLLAGVVAAFGFVVGTPLGAVAGLA